ncbi:MAG: TetR/AcrR family transcriptional regulator [Comamonadaceae bacterium]|nr:MAG: TetR/AcrR family transcriptional regulator [Comamonadaceae bacterium]
MPDASRPTKTPAPARAPRRTHAERSQSTQQHLIATAIQVIQDRSYESASIFEVAKSAGVTPGAVQHHFDSKANLMMHVLSQLIADKDREGSLWPEPGLPLAERARHFVHAAWQMSYGQPRFVAAWNIYLGSRTQPELLEHIADQRAALNARLREGFLKAFPELDAQGDAAVFVAMVFSTLRGLGLLEIFRPADEPVEAQLACLADTIILRCSQPAKAVKSVKAVKKERASK